MPGANHFLTHVTQTRPQFLVLQCRDSKSPHFMELTVCTSLSYIIALYLPGPSHTWAWVLPDASIPTWTSPLSLPGALLP